MIESQHSQSGCAAGHEARAGLARSLFRKGLGSGRKEKQEDAALKGRRYMIESQHSQSGRATGHRARAGLARSLFRKGLGSGRKEKQEDAALKGGAT